MERVRCTIQLRRHRRVPAATEANMRGVFTEAPPSGSKHAAFGTFLETLRPDQPAMEGVVHRTVGNVTPVDEGPSFSRRVLEYLSTNGEQPTARLVEVMNVSVLEFADALRALVDAGLVQVSKSDSGEAVGLTELGRKISTLP